MKLRKKLAVTVTLFIIVGAGLGTAVAFGYLNIHQPKIQKTAYGDIYLAFTGEVYDKIKNNYWDKVPDDQLAILYKLAIDKVTTKTSTSDPKTKDDIIQLIKTTIADYDKDKKKEFVASVNDIVLANLKPFGRSRLYTQKETQALSDTVVNKDTATDLYAAIGADKNATPKDIATAYQKTENELRNDKTPEGQQKLAEAKRAYDALSNPDNKAVYDQTKIEPTVIYKLLTSDIFYIHLTKFSPQSFDELQKAINSIDPAKKNGPTSMILDLRGNIGGAIDILQYFLGPFIGPDRYAYEFFHQGDTTPFKTKVGWLAGLVRYKKVVVLINEKDQSSTEVMAATLKKYNVGVLVGTTTKGWGTVESVIPLEQQIDPNEKFSVLMVHDLTLRDDGQPIEGKGVDPTINIKDKDWQKQLMSYFNYPGLVEEVRKLVQ